MAGAIGRGNGVRPWRQALRSRWEKILTDAAGLISLIVAINGCPGIDPDSPVDRPSALREPLIKGVVTAATGAEVAGLFGKGGVVGAVPVWELCRYLGLASAGERVAPCRRPLIRQPAEHVAVKAGDDAVIAVLAEWNDDMLRRR